MFVTRDIESCRRAIRQAQADGRRVGVVPTMGALHEGHLSLIRTCHESCEYSAVTIFVNPTQFGPGEDLAKYPERFEADADLCTSRGVNLLFAPTVETMYPGGERTTIHVSGLTDGLCGPHRPRHFDGVATVVAKLFHILPADAAFFGEKDYQQLAVIRAMVQDLNIPTEIVGCPIVREADGLAMSSRNAHLSPETRKQATSLSRALFRAVDEIDAGEHDARAIAAFIRSEIEQAGDCEIDYIEVVDATTLEVLSIVDRPARICLAVRIGGVRLIDNVAVGTSSRLGCGS